MKSRLAMELVGSAVKVTVGSHRECVRPQYAWIVNDRLPAAIGQALANTVVFIVASIDSTFAVSLQPVRWPFFAQILSCIGELLLGDVRVAQELCRYRIQVAAGQWAEVQSLAIRRQSNTVRSDGKWLAASTGIADSQQLTFNPWHEVWIS